MTFEEEVYKELENERISNAGDFAPKVEQQIRYCLGDQYTEPIIEPKEIRISPLPSSDEIQDQIRTGSPIQINSEMKNESKTEFKGNDNGQEIRISPLPSLDETEEQSRM